MEDSFSKQFTTQLVQQLPMLFAAIAAIIVAIVCWRRSSGAAVLTVIGAALLLLTSVLFPYLFVDTNVRISEGRLDPQDISDRYNVLSFLWSLGIAASLVLWLVAIFIGRRPAAGDAYPVQTYAGQAYPPQGYYVPQQQQPSQQYPGYPPNYR